MTNVNQESIWPGVHYPSDIPDVLILAGAKEALSKVKKHAELTVNCLLVRNPFLEHDLKNHDGLSQEVRTFLAKQVTYVKVVKEAQEDLGKIIKKVAKRPATVPPILVVCYCQGGHHRSPAVGLALATLVARDYPMLDIELRRVPYKPSTNMWNMPRYQPISDTATLTDLELATDLVIRYGPPPADIVDQTDNSAAAVAQRKQAMLNDQPTMVTMDKLAFEVACPHCDSPPWVRCNKTQVDASQNPLWPHSERIKAGYKNAGITPPGQQGGFDGDINPFQ